MYILLRAQGGRPILGLPGQPWEEQSQAQGIVPLCPKDTAQHCFPASAPGGRATEGTWGLGTRDSVLLAILAVTEPQTLDLP